MWKEALFDITKLHRIVPVVVIILNGLTVGVFAGFAGLALAMRRERQFCVEAECDSRSYNLVFNCAWIGQALLGPFNGYVLDRAGPRVLTLIGALLAMAGLLFIANSDTSPGANGTYAGFNGWAGGFFLLGAAAPALQSPLFQLANLFVNRSAITSSVVSMFILSTAILPIVNEIHYAAGGQVSLRSLLLGLLVQPALCCCTSLLLIPRTSIPATFLAEKERAIEEARLPAPVVVSEKLLKQTPSGRRLLRRRVRRFRLRRALSDAPPRLQRSKQSKVFPLSRLVALGKGKHGFWRQALSLEAIVAFFYFGFGLVHFNWYVASSRDQLVALGDDGLLSRAFPFILPAGVLATPLIGLLLDRGGIVATIWLSSLNVVLIAVLTLIPSLQAQWLTFLLLSVGRPLHMSLFFSCFGLFGLQHFGKLTSSIGFVIFGATNQLQFALLELVQVDASGRKDFTHANAVLLALAVGLGVAMSVMGCIRLR
jgi:MFS family permease